MPQAWRLTSARRAATAFTGDGALLLGGRWHHAGTRCIYVSSALSLAALEVMVHSGGGRPALPFVAFRVGIPDDVRIDAVPERVLTPGWRRFPAPIELADYGSAWIATEQSAVLRVPSALSPHESNFLLNPAHADFARLTVSAPEPFEFDERLLLGQP